MKKLLLMATALGVFSGVYAKKVKFQVDMTGQTVSANGVHVAGNFQAAAGASGDWKPNETPLSNGGSGNIYSAVVDIPAHRVYEFKFINDNNWGAGEENIPIISRVEQVATGGNSNRWIYIDSTANDTMVLPAIQFAGAAPAGLNAIRFTVDMQKEVAVSSEGVRVTGAWVSFGTDFIMTNLINTNKIYEYIGYFPAGSLEYKFKNGSSGWEGNFSAPCGANNNRSTTVSASAALPKVCFNSCDACPTAPVPMYTATFLIDMSNSDCDGGFDTVTVTGSRPQISSWGAGIQLFPISSGSKIFAVVVDSLDSGQVEFKFRKHKNGITSWEGGDNRKWDLKADNSILDTTCFGLRVVGTCDPKPAASDVTFMVDMSNETPDGQGRIYVIGDFTTPQWQSGAIRLSPVSGKPGFYSTTVNICPGVISYKFMNGDSSATGMEEGFPDSTKRDCLVPSGVGGYNRTYTRATANPVTLAFVYNSCDLADTTTTGLKEKAGLLNNVRLYPNPTNGLVNIEFNDLAKSHNVIVTDIAGRALANFNDVSDNKLTISKSDLAKGMLFISITNSRGESKTVKLIVQ